MRDQEQQVPTTTVRVEQNDTWLRLYDSDSTWADFHYRWLRHNCECDRHPSTHERTLCSSDLPDHVVPRSVNVTPEGLHLVWEPDGHETRFDLSWLKTHAYAANRKAPPPPASTVASVEISWGDHPLSQVVETALSRVRSHGVAVVRRDPTRGHQAEGETEAIIEAFNGGGFRVIGTHFGRIEDLRTDNTTNQNTDQLGYTDAPVALHTDQPFLDQPPRYQLLQCIRSATEGGSNTLADARAAVAFLRSLDARAAELLCTIPVRFHRKQKHFEREVIGPLVSRTGDDDFMIRLSYFTLAPHQIPFAQMEEYYRAHDRFVRLVRDPRYHYHAHLAPGDWLVYDNHRMLHSRTGFRGARWLRGVYFDPA